MTRTVLALLLMVMLLAAGGCGSARRSEPIVGRVVASAPQFAEGRKVFAQHCHACHPGGEGGLGPALNDKPLPRALIKFQVRRGLGTMPALDEHHISQRELDAVADYLVALRRSE